MAIRLMRGFEVAVIDPDRSFLPDVIREDIGSRDGCSKV